jgi:PTH2 family peptidyl-tRNA hydrolase
MTVGKLAAQAGHAYLDAFLEAPPDVAALYRTDGHGTKVCLAARSLDELLLARELAKAHGLPNALVVDSGHVHPPHFDGSPIATALGLGPVTRDQARPVVGRFRLLTTTEEKVR